MKYFALGILVWALTSLFGPPKSVNTKTWYEAERICHADGSSALRVQERKVYQHTVICAN